MFRKSRPDTETASRTAPAPDKGALANMNFLTIDGSSARCTISPDGTCIHGQEVMRNGSGQIVGLLPPAWTRKPDADKELVQMRFDAGVLARWRGCNTCTVATVYAPKEKSKAPAHKRIRLGRLSL